MPVVFDNIQFNNWMRGTPDQPAPMMKPYAGEIERREAPAEVGNVKNKRPEMMERLGSWYSAAPRADCYWASRRRASNRSLVHLPSTTCLGSVAGM
jgi:hypothetical protein